MNESLRAELLQRAKADQAERTADPVDRSRLQAVDDDNTRWIRSIVESHGWPGATLVGEDGAFAAWLLVQHAPLDLQEECLPLLERAVEQGEASKVHWAYLLDRVLMRRGDPQVYGTQVVSKDGSVQPHPIKDPDHVDDRRAELGLEPLAEYLQRFK